jgi:hypothetical protein
MSLTNHLEQALLEHLLGVATFAAPTIHVGIGTAGSGEGGTGLSEPGGGGYARVAHGDWSAATGRSAANDASIDFPVADADWGTITHFALFDAASAGNMLAYGPLDVPRAIFAGDQATLPAGEVTLAFAPGAFSDHLAHALLDHLLGTAAYSPPTIHVALSSTAIDDDGSGATEPGDGYARVTHGDWIVAGGAAGNDGAVAFPAATDDWPTLSHLALFDASSGGNLLVHAPLTRSVAVLQGDAVQFADAALTVALD